MCVYVFFVPGFLQVRKNWKKSEFEWSRKVRERSGENIVLLEKSGKMKNWCDQMSEFRG